MNKTLRVEIELETDIGIMDELEKKVRAQLKSLDVKKLEIKTFIGWKGMWC